MRPSRSPALLIWSLTFTVLVGLFAVAYWVHAEMREERAREESGDKVQSPKRSKNGIVDIGAEIVASYGLKEESAQEVSWVERAPVYGRVVPNPRATVDVRSPFAGMLQADPEAVWPAPGELVRAGQLLGWVNIRVTPEVLLDLQNKLDAARLQVKGTEEQIRVQQERVNRLKSVTSQEIISRGELDLALVQLAAFQTQLATANATADLYRSAIEEVGRRDEHKASKWRQPLIAPADGEVTDLTGRPGMSIEAGGSITQVVDFRRPLVRLDISPEIVADGPPSRVELFAVPANPTSSWSALSRAETGKEYPAARATLAGLAPHLETASQFVSYWYEVNTAPPWDVNADKPEATAPDNRRAAWRPGLQVKAYVKRPSAQPQPAVSVPASAVLYHQGQALVYVRVGPGKYARRDVRLLGREGDCWILGPSQTLAQAVVRPGEPVVTRQSQVLLSEEFRIDTANN